MLSAHIITLIIGGHYSIIYGVKNTNKLEITINTLLRMVIEEEPLPELDSYFQGFLDKISPLGKWGWVNRVKK